MTATLSSSATDPSCEIACTRTYKATKDLLFRMWSDPEHITHWWGPRGFTTTTHEMEFKTGGFWRFTMHDPDGTDYLNFLRYTEVSPDRIEYEQTFLKDVNFTVSVDFREVAEGTEMSFRMIFPSPDKRQQVIDRLNAAEVLKVTLARLEEYIIETGS